MGYYLIEDQAFKVCITHGGHCQNFHVFFDQEAFDRLKVALQHAQASGGQNVRFVDQKDRGYEFDLPQAYQVLASATASGKFK